MGLTDWFDEVTDTLTSAAKAALETTRRLAEEAKRELDRRLHEAEQIVDNMTAKVRNTADEMKRDLEAAVPSFDGKLQEIIDDITEAASKAADEGVDITESINGAVEIVFQQIEKALKAAIDAVNRFLHEASERLFRLLDGVLPEFLNHLLSPVKSLIDFILKSLGFLADKLKVGVSAAVQTIKSTVQAIVRKIGEVLGPIWDYVKKLWKLLFGTEPEQCSLTAQWFDERMRRTEKQLLNKPSEEQVNTLIRKRTFLELLPPDENSWRALVPEFLNRADTSPAWATYGARLGPVLQSTSPRDGSLVQLTVDEPFTDRLGGRQRIQISILYYRWRTESFRKVSSGFLGILAMISAVGKQEKTHETPKTQTMREQPLQIDAAVVKEIYEIIEPHPWLGKLKSDQKLIFAQDMKAHISLQTILRGDDGVWRDTAKA
ncbi:MAG: hypothetical protein Q9214_001521 [Letrouitia sp. 1 TL-2023]